MNLNRCLLDLFQPYVAPVEYFHTHSVFVYLLESLSMKKQHSMYLCTFLCVLHVYKCTRPFESFSVFKRVSYSHCLLIFFSNSDKRYKKRSQCFETKCNELEGKWKSIKVREKERD